MKKLFGQTTRLFLSIFTSTLLLGLPAQAYLELGETAELLPDGMFKLGVAPQLKLSEGTGLNVGVYFDTFVTDDLNGRVTLGGGKTDFWTSASIKWVPFPDVGRQPAIGGRAAIIYSRYDNLDFYSFQISPILSKLAMTEYGKMIPFIGLPITFTKNKNESIVATQLAIGAEWFSKKDIHVGAEFDLNLNKSFSAITTFISFPFDQSVGYKKN